LFLSAPENSFPSNVPLTPKLNTLPPSHVPSFHQFRMYSPMVSVLSRKLSMNRFGLFYSPPPPLYQPTIFSQKPSSQPSFFRQRLLRLLIQFSCLKCHALLIYPLLQPISPESAPPSMPPFGTKKSSRPCRHTATPYFVAVWFPPHFPTLRNIHCQNFSPFFESGSPPRDFPVLRCNYYPPHPVDQTMISPFEREHIAAVISFSPMITFELLSEASTLHIAFMPCPPSKRAPVFMPIISFLKASTGSVSTISFSDIKKTSHLSHSTARPHHLLPSFSVGFFSSPFL